MLWDMLSLGAWRMGLGWSGKKIRCRRRRRPRPLPFRHLWTFSIQCSVFSIQCSVLVWKNRGGKWYARKAKKKKTTFPTRRNEQGCRPASNRLEQAAPNRIPSLSREFSPSMCRLHSCTATTFRPKFYSRSPLPVHWINSSLDWQASQAWQLYFFCIFAYIHDTCSNILSYFIIFMRVHIVHVRAYF